MKFNLQNNHIIVAVETDAGLKNCVFDTGSPLTVFFDPILWFSFCSVEHKPVPFNPMADMLALYRPSIESLIGMSIDGIIGGDTFNDKNVLIDFKNMELYVSSEPLDPSFDVHMDGVFGLPHFGMDVNGVTLYGAFDSGAMYSFVSTEAVKSLNLTSQNKTIEDFNPLLGNFTAELYTGDLQIGKTDLGANTIAVSKAYDSALTMMGVSVFFGTDALKDRVIGLSYIEGRMGVKE